MKLTASAIQVLTEIMENVECTIRTTADQITITANKDNHTVWLNDETTAEETLINFLEHVQNIPEFTEVNGGHLMTMAEFKDGVDCGGLTDDDGEGYYAIGKNMSRNYVDFREVEAGKVDPRYTHVVWYNK